MKKIIILVILGLFSFAVSAHDYHYYPDPAAQQTITQVTKNIYNTTGVAMALAAGEHHCDWGTQTVQLDFSVANYQDNNGLSVALCKRAGAQLLHGSVSSENNGNLGVSFGVRINLK